ncbi:hypothetical protein RR48_03476 [Papilio machaon]|uniref:Uncharacterized protein n=1 Tax=Papilio machaon TaxID=76193 RepID=A0A0N1PHQ9_PAPMA|nr:hypothetical protein RR48_03476 [Papilio machaon]
MPSLLRALTIHETWLVPLVPPLLALHHVSRSPVDLFFQRDVINQVFPRVNQAVRARRPRRERNASVVGARRHHATAQQRPTPPNDAQHLPPPKFCFIYVRRVRITLELTQKFSSNMREPLSCGSTTKLAAHGLMRCIITMLANESQDSRLVAV